MKKYIITLLAMLLMGAGIVVAAKTTRDSHYPLPIEPSDTWEPYVQNLDAERESLFVFSDGVQLEADLFIPNDGGTRKAAIVFTPGSGDSLYQNYAEGFVEHYILETFLQRDIAVLLMNKRGMGLSEGNYVSNSIQGRARDVYAGVQMLQSHPSIDASQIGVVGHSQGGWVVSLVASQHSDVAFYISMAGPTMSMERNAADNYHNMGYCNGLEGSELDDYVERRMKMVQYSVSIGKITNFGMFGFDARNMSYDPALALSTANQDGLLLFAELDSLVTPSINLEQLQAIFEGETPPRITTYTLRGANHAFQIVPDICSQRTPNLSPEYFEIIGSWLATHVNASPKNTTASAVAISTH